MVSEVPSPLGEVVMRSPDGWRLVFIRHRVRHLAATAAGTVVIPLIIASPLVVFVLLPIVGGWVGFSAAWHTALAALCVLTVVGTLLAGLSLYDETSATRWVELSPPQHPTLAVVKSVFGTTRLEVSGLRRIRVVEQVTLGRTTGVEVVFDTTGAQVTGRCALAALPDAGPTELTDWLADLLRPAGVAVTYTKTVRRARLTIENWWTADKVAATWHVPAQAVHHIADRLDVRSHCFEPRVGAFYQPGRQILLYDPDDIHDIAEQLATGVAAHRVAGLLLRQLADLVGPATPRQSRENVIPDPAADLLSDTEMPERYRIALRLLNIASRNQQQTQLAEAADPSPADVSAYRTYVQYSLCQVLRDEPLPPPAPPPGMRADGQAPWTAPDTPDADQVAALVGRLLASSR